jgi:hypothetical protein
LGDKAEDALPADATKAQREWWRIRQAGRTYSPETLRMTLSEEQRELIRSSYNRFAVITWEAQGPDPPVPMSTELLLQALKDETDPQRRETWAQLLVVRLRDDPTVS